MKNKYAQYNASTVAFAGFLMLFWAWFAGDWYYPRDASRVFVLSLHAFDWTLIIGGVAMLIVAAICFLGQRVGLLLETIVSGAIGLVFLLCAAIWVIGSSIGMQTILNGIFGFMFVSAARSAWTMYRSGAPDLTTTGFPVQAVKAPEAPPAPHPASLASSALPKDGEPAPDEGYLAALAKEED